MSKVAKFDFDPNSTPWPDRLVSLRKGEIVDVIKNPGHGWTLIQQIQGARLQGYVPTGYLRDRHVINRDPNAKKNQRWINRTAKAHQIKMTWCGNFSAALPEDTEVLDLEFGNAVIVLEELKNGWSIGETTDGDVGYMRTSAYQMEHPGREKKNDDSAAPNAARALFGAAALGGASKVQTVKKKPVTFVDMKAKLSVLIEKYTDTKYNVDEIFSLTRDQETRLIATVGKHYPLVSGMWLPGDFNETTLREVLRKANLIEDPAAFFESDSSDDNKGGYNNYRTEAPKEKVTNAFQEEEEKKKAAKQKKKEDKDKQNQKNGGYFSKRALFFGLSPSVMQAAGQGFGFLRPTSPWKMLAKKDYTDLIGKAENALNLSAKDIELEKKKKEDMTEEEYAQYKAQKKAKKDEMKNKLLEKAQKAKDKKKDKSPDNRNSKESIESSNPENTQAHYITMNENNEAPQLGEKTDEQMKKIEKEYERGRRRKEREERREKEKRQKRKEKEKFMEKKRKERERAGLPSLDQNPEKTSSLAVQLPNIYTRDNPAVYPERDLFEEQQRRKQSPDRQQKPQLARAESGQGMFLARQQSKAAMPSFDNPSVHTRTFEQKRADVSLPNLNLQERLSPQALKLHEERARQQRAEEERKLILEKDMRGGADPTRKRRQMLLQLRLKEELDELEHQRRKEREYQEKRAKSPINKVRQMYAQRPLSPFSRHMNQQNNESSERRSQSPNTKRPLSPMQKFSGYTRRVGGTLSQAMGGYRASRLV